MFKQIFAFERGIIFTCGCLTSVVAVFFPFPLRILLIVNMYILIMRSWTIVPFVLVLVFRFVCQSGLFIKEADIVDFLCFNFLNYFSTCPAMFFYFE